MLLTQRQQVLSRLRQPVVHLVLQVDQLWLRLCTVCSTSTCHLQRGFTAHVPRTRLIEVRVVVRLHLYFDLGHGAGHPSAQGHSRR